MSAALTDMGGGGVLRNHMTRPEWADKREVFRYFLEVIVKMGVRMGSSLDSKLRVDKLGLKLQNSTFIKLVDCFSHLSHTVLFIHSFPFKFHTHCIVCDS